MIIDIESNAKRIVKIKFILYPVIALLLCLLQISVVNFIEIGGLTPNLLIILTIWIAVTEGQFSGLFAAFGIGILLDILSYDVIGTNALAQVLAAFVTGFFYKEGKNKLTVRKFFFMMIIFLGALSHNLVYFFLYIKFSELNFFHFFLRYGIAATLYTTIFGFFPVLLNLPGRRYNI